MYCLVFSGCVTSTATQTLFFTGPPDAHVGRQPIKIEQVDKISLFFGSIITPQA